jgi:hypothetical protein
LFSFLVLAVIGSIALAATLVASFAVWPWKSAVIVAFVAVPAGFAGAGLVLIAQVPFWPHTLLGVQPAIYLGVGATAGLASAISGAWLVVRLLRIVPR